LEQLAGATEYVDVPPGEAVVREGEEADAFYVIVDGRFAVSARGEGDEEQALRELEAGEYFGEIGLIERIPRTATVTAAKQSQLLRVTGADFVDALTEATPSVALLEGTSARLRRTHPTLEAGRRVAR